MKLRSEVCSQNEVPVICQGQDSFKEIARRLKMGKLVGMLLSMCFVPDAALSTLWIYAVPRRPYNIDTNVSVSPVGDPEQQVT